MIAELGTVLDRVEELIAVPGGELDVAALAREVHTTEYHLRRMFSSLAGLPLSEYVRRRRMTLAAADLTGGTDDLLTVAVRHGYGSTEAFGRAFRAVHGARPADVRRDGGPVRAQSRLRFHLTVEGSEPMDVHVHDLPAFRLLGPTVRVPLIHHGVNPHIAAFLESLPRGTDAALAAAGAQHGGVPDGPTGTLAVSDGVDPDGTEGSMLTYQHGIAVPAGTPAEVTDLPGPPGSVVIEAIDVPAGTWAVFASSGPFPDALQDVWARTATEWFPSQPYRQRPGPSLLAAEYDWSDRSAPRAAARLWLPVERA
ncbi:AraC family transcriptional regulator [Nocardioides zeae]|uniref:AraC family transcriptional regulator n=1 Tax=Nocardioides imazamoxiresistens TaxID=3231893 RepID=A0ABU3PV38_9ACTN|nr:AraC family transcriptional regulator [Nocardioides zeae]MDT9593103.1 AraC family transcriptional regulator [Nocardioides zeae]